MVGDEPVTPPRSAEWRPGQRSNMCRGSTVAASWQLERAARSTEPPSMRYSCETCPSPAWITTATRARLDALAPGLVHNVHRPTAHPAVAGGVLKRKGGPSDKRVALPIADVCGMLRQMDPMASARAGVWLTSMDMALAHRCEVFVAPFEHQTDNSSFVQALRDWGM